jgi:predicted RNA-binding protein associated with RNAse of E/G family
VRLPDPVLSFYDELVYKSGRVVIGKSHVKFVHEVEFDGEVVLADGFQFLYSDLMDKWFTVGKIRDLQGKHTGYYCDIVTPPKLLGDGGVKITDLFLTSGSRPI